MAEVSRTARGPADAVDADRRIELQLEELSTSLAFWRRNASAARLQEQRPVSAGFGVPSPLLVGCLVDGRGERSCRGSSVPTTTVAIPRRSASVVNVAGSGLTVRVAEEIRELPRGALERRCAVS